MPVTFIPKEDTERSSESLFASFQTNIETCQKRVQSLRQEKERENPPDLKEVMAELDQLDVFLKGRLTKRLLGVKSFPEELKKNYLRCIEPFYTEEGITRFIGHYFDVESFKQVRLRYRKKKDFEKEVNILFDLYRVKKTIETITTLETSIISSTPFPSRFAKGEQAEFLRTLKEIFKLFFQRFVKKEYRKPLFQSLSEGNLETDEIIAMRKSGISYLIPDILKTNEYREKFITIYFSTLLRTKTSTEVKDLHFNYLNFELLKNEFLTDWIQRKLKGNPEKDKVLQNYQLGGTSISQLIKENPGKESEILSSIPLDQFNDIAEQVNETVKPEMKTPVNTFSKNHGLFARLQESFAVVKHIARFSVEKMEEMKPKSKIWTVKKKTVAKPIVPVAPKTPAVKPQPQKQEPKPVLEVNYDLEVLKMEDLDFPFFDKRPETYKAKLGYLAQKTGTDYEKLRAMIWTIFNQIAKEHVIIRKTPHHEWVVPLLFSQNSKRFLLIAGAEISEKDQIAGYKSRYLKSNYALNAFYLLATQNINNQFGKVNDTRKVKKVPFHLYSCKEQSVQTMALSLLGQLSQSKIKGTSKQSNLKLRNPKEPFAELTDLRDLLGLDPKHKQEKQTQNGKPTPAQNPQPQAEIKSTIKQDKPMVNDIREVAKNLKRELEEEKNKAVVPEIKPPSGKPKDIHDVAAQVKREMQEEKARKAEEMAKYGNTSKPQKVKDIRQVASELKQEMNRN